jgi:type I restriction enzyme S subunit
MYWNTAKLTEVVRINPRNVDFALDDSDEVSFLPMAGVEAETGRINITEKRTWKTVKKGYTKFQENDVLVAKITPCMENGKACIARHLHGAAGAGSTEFHVFRPNTKIIEPEWLYLFLNQQRIRSAAKRQMGGAVGQQRVPASFYESLVLPLPDIEKQRDLLESLIGQGVRITNIEEELRSVLKKLKQARASILKAAVEGRLVETEAKKSNARLSDHSSSQDQQEGIAIPEGWSIHQAKTVCNSIESGTTPSKEHFRDSPDEGVPFIKVYHLTFTGNLSFWENKPTYVSKEYHSSKMKRSLTIPGDVLTNIVGPPLGKVSVVPSKSHEWNINQAIARFRCGPTLLPAFLAIYLQSYQAQSWLASTSKTTTSQVNLSISNSRLLPIPVPPFHEQEQIVAEVNRRFSVLDQVEATVTASLARCGVLRQAILKRAFRQDAT